MDARCYICQDTGKCVWCKGAKIVPLLSTGLGKSMEWATCYRCNGTGKCPCKDRPDKRCIP